ncbi:MAG: methylated-DNA--[protein]-cysteine S-methyltransferase [Planctomycetaceae bacterium]
MAAGLSLRVATFATPLGAFGVLVSDDGVVATTATDPARLAAELGAAWTEDPGGLRAVERELDGYFAGHVRRFAVPVDLRLAPTPFARAVLQATCAIPYGELRTYGDVAAEAGRAGAARAAGSALRRSPIELFVPCHRVVPAGPGFGHYGGEEDRRLRLLRLEGAI